MKITHNKIGQNLNLSDSGKADKADKSDKIAKGLGDLGGAKAEALASSGLSDSSKVELSAKAKEAKRIKDLAMAAPDIDQEKVARFREMIDNGTYKVDAQAIADRMVDEHLEF